MGLATTRGAETSESVLICVKLRPVRKPLNGSRLPLVTLSNKRGPERKFPRARGPALDDAVTTMATSPPLAENPFAPEHLQNPYEPLGALRDQGAIQRAAHHGGIDNWLILGFEEAREALRTPALSTDPSHARRVFRRAGLVIEREDEEPPATLLTSDPPDHTRLRRLVARAFTPRRAQRLRSDIQRLVDELIDAVAAAGEADLVADVAFPLPVTVIARLLGVPEGDRDAFRRWTQEMQAPPQLDDAEARKLAGRDALHAYLRAYIDATRARLDPAAADDEHPDLGSALIAAADRGEALSEPELVALLEELLIGGYETAANFIANALFALLVHPDQLDLLRREPERIPDAVEELLRYDGSVLRAVPRVAVEDVEIGGTTIPRGALVTIVLGAANRDARAHIDPDRLDIRRRGAHHVAFGHGIHFCPGAGLARVESEIALSTVIRRLEELRLACPPADVRWRPAGVMRALEALPVRFRPVRA
jgi:cytochrome P450